MGEILRLVQVYSGAFERYTIVDMAKLKNRGNQC